MSREVRDRSIPPDEDLYQLIIARLDGDRISEASYCTGALDLVRRGIGGFILFGGHRDRIAPFIRRLQASAATTPLFIAADIERGVGQQVRGTTVFPCPMAFAAAVDRHNREDRALLESCLRSVAAEAKDIGINMPLIPVVDVNSEPENPIICTRAFSDRPEDVAWFGEQFVKVLEGEGLLSCAKHFPGHGRTTADSHLSLPVIAASLEALREVDLLPFLRCIRAGAGSVMVGHLSVPCLDSRPASISEVVIERLLRKDLGFGGLVVTDALNMGGLAGVTDVAAASLGAGADVLLHPADAHAAVQEISAALSAGTIPVERVNRALSRIRTAKEKFSQVPPAMVDADRHCRLSSEVTGRSLTLVASKPRVLPLTDLKKALLIQAGNGPTPLIPSFGSLFGATLSLRDLRDRLPDLSERLLVVAVFTSVAAWKGTSGISDTDRQLVTGLIARAGRSIVVSFGSPYVLRHFRHADALVAAYEGSESAQEAVLRALSGECAFRGRLPVTLDGV